MASAPFAALSLITDRSNSIRFDHPDNLEQPTDADAMPAGMCTRCGLVGEHSGPAVCIDGLRDRIATLEFKLSTARFSTRSPAAPEKVPAVDPGPRFHERQFKTKREMMSALRARLGS